MGVLLLALMIILGKDIFACKSIFKAWAIFVEFMIPFAVNFCRQMQGTWIQFDALFIYRKEINTFPPHGIEQYEFGMHTSKEVIPRGGELFEFATLFVKKKDKKTMINAKMFGKNELFDFIFFVTFKASYLFVSGV